MKLAARIGDPHTCPAAGSLPFDVGNPGGGCPHVGGPIATPGAATVLTESALASRLADGATCVGAQMAVICQGASTVLILELPAVRALDETTHGGHVTLGAKGVYIGGPSFAVPANVAIVGSADFQNKVVRDLYLLSTTRTGREILRRLEASGKPIVILEESPDDGSSMVVAGIPPAGSVIFYNANGPRDRLGEAGQPIPGPTQVSLGHELIHAVHAAEDTRGSGTDPNGPTSQRDIEDEEAKTIGVGSHAHAFPSENSLRDDLGLPRRANHFGVKGPASVPPFTLRPGGY